jgi:hypothetical protein
MSRGQGANAVSASPTWVQFKIAVQQIDRDSLLVQAAAATATIERGELAEHVKRKGVTPWTIADVARTALAWGGKRHRKADSETLIRLCNMNALLADQAAITNPGDAGILARVLARIMFEQFPGQRAVAAEIARSFLLYGPQAEHPPGFTPEAMTPGWFEGTTGGLTFDDYIESVFLIATEAARRNGGFDPQWFKGTAFQGLGDVISYTAIRRTFIEHLLTTVPEFNDTNNKFQDPLPDSLKKFAFNPLTDKPFVDGLAEIAIAPCVQTIIARAQPPAIYHLARRVLGDEFTRDLGAIFQHYTGRQLGLVEGSRTVIPEVQYKQRKDSFASCDWFLDLPGLLVLIECKARQPIEEVRTAADDWLRTVKTSVGKGIDQINRSNNHITAIGAEDPRIDATKPRVGLVVTLEPFYIDQNWLVWDELPAPDVPIGVVSIGELESLVLLDADELANALRDTADSAQENVMLLAPAFAATAGRENALLTSTYDAIGLFDRVSKRTGRPRRTRSNGGQRYESPV